MQNADQNELITRIGPGTPCGQLMRHYWHPVALLDPDRRVRVDGTMVRRALATGGDRRRAAVAGLATQAPRGTVAARRDRTAIAGSNCACFAEPLAAPTKHPKPPHRRYPRSAARIRAKHPSLCA